MKYSNLEIDIKNPVVTIWINRPEIKNALDGATFKELLDYLNEIKRNSGIRLLLLRGKGDNFSSGADLNWMLASGKKGRIQNLLESRTIAKCMSALYTIPFPTIAVAQGNVYGGAIGLLSACDIIISNQDTKFCFSEVRLGLVPSIIMPYILKKIKNKDISHLFYTARPFDADTAEKLGLIDYKVDSKSIETTIDDVKNNILSGAPNALKECKKMIRLCSGEISSNLINKTIVSITELKRSVEGKEGIQAFIDKRKPNWDKRNTFGVIRCQ
jgi:methylglutaconyl-CoA hydratase